MQYIGAFTENLHTGLHDVEMEGWCQHVMMADPLVTSTQQEPISW
jgi:hypothetical protein